jgi:hypothetical protein
MKRRNIWSFTLLAISSICLVTWPDIASAQSVPRLKPIPSWRGSHHAAALAPDPRSAWQPLANQAPSGPNGIQIMIQGTDGSILVQSYDGQTWMKLTPDDRGSYINGTWTTLASEPIARLYFASQILPDGRLFVAGGEYSGPGLAANWSNTGEIYDPLTNTWTPINPYPNQPGCPRLSYITGNLTTGSAQITGIYPYTSGLLVGKAVVFDSASGIPAGATIVSIDSPSQITISAPATATAAADFIQFNFRYRLTGCLGDDPSILLPGEKILVGDLINSNTYIYEPASDTWVASGTKVYPDSSDEEGWTMAGDGSIINYDLFQSIATGGSYGEKYTPTTGIWTGISPTDGTANGTIPQLSNPNVGFELGPALRLQDGRIFVIGATQHTALYTPSTNTWAAGPDISGTLNGIASPFGADDAPGAILPNGHVIFAADAGPAEFTSSGNITAGSAVITGIPSTAILQQFWSVSDSAGGVAGGAFILSVDSPSQVTISQSATQTITGDSISWGGVFSNPTQLFDFDPGRNALSPISPAIPDGNLPFQGSYPSRMLILPTGQVLFSDASSQLWVYTSTGMADPRLRPIITGVKYNGGGTFILTGKQLNGQSAGAAYGDDDQMNSNYPIIRMVSGSGNVYYARTTNWSKIGIDGGHGKDSAETVNFTLNPGLTAGHYKLIVSGAGISSNPIDIHITDDEVGGGDKDP